MSSSNDDPHRPSGGYSASVHMALHINGSRLPLAKVGPDRLYLRTPQALLATSGEVVMRIDGQERRWRVALQPSPAPSQVIAAQFEPQ